MSRVGFIGLGQMGSPMASNILKGDHEVKVFDLNADAVNGLVELGATAAESALDAAKDVDFIITMLPNGDLVRHVLFGEQGIAQVITPETLLIDMSTIHPFQTDKLVSDMDQRGLQMMEAPVGRTSDHAVKGELLILAGGSKAQIERAQPLFDCMGSETV
ncbi:NAD(P)-binding domain-containing protein, partial [Vibrio sp. OPT18]|uniref:NAD(P)-binding domain-containing protein n=1 Tax=Vibrio sp. OPT18 TaxID=2778641 RepID=UPI001D1509E7